jgi:hypothetical protein
VLISYFSLLPWRLRRYVPPKRRLTPLLHGVTSQKTAFFKLPIVCEILKLLMSPVHIMITFFNENHFSIILCETTGVPSGPLGWRDFGEEEHIYMLTNFSYTYDVYTATWDCTEMKNGEVHLNILRPPNMKRWFSKCCLSVYKDVPLANIYLDRRKYKDYANFSRDVL